MARCNCNTGTHTNHHGRHCNRPAQTKDGLCEDCAAYIAADAQAKLPPEPSRAALFYPRGGKTEPTR